MKPNYGYKRFQYFMVCGMLMIEKLHKKFKNRYVKRVKTIFFVSLQKNDSIDEFSY